MAIAEMRKVLLIGEKEFRERVVKKLGEAGIFQSHSPDCCIFHRSFPI